MDNPLSVSSAVAPSLFSFTRFVFTSPYQLHISPTSTQVDPECHYDPLLHSPLSDAMQAQSAIIVSSDDESQFSSVHLHAPHAITSAKPKVRRTARMCAQTHHSSSEGSRERGEFDPKKKKQMRTSDSTSATPSVRRSSRLTTSPHTSRLPEQADDSSSESSSDDDSPLVPLVPLSVGSTFVACDTDSARISLKAIFKGSHVHGHVVCNNSR